MTAPLVLWFRNDLRLADNAALAAAVEAGHPVVALYVLDEESEGLRAPGGASRWWLHGSLEALAADLDRHGVPLVLRRGSAATIVPEVARACDAAAVLWNRLYEPAAVARDRGIKRDLETAGLRVRSFAGAMLNEPWSVMTGADKPYRVFTPYWKSARTRAPGSPLPAPRRIAGVSPAPPGERLADWSLRPVAPDWAGGLREMWTPGEAAAQERLDAFAADGLADYAEGRDRPGDGQTSRLSPHLHFGELSPRAVWHRASRAAAAGEAGEAAVEAYLREIGWRDFCMQLLFHFPDLPTRNMRPEFDRFEWRDDEKGLRAWQRGQTGYPFVDAAMRELWATGWMHNRARMVAASFLVKDLLVDWRAGEAWFWDTLVDADLASNVGGWQWVAGSGADAAPFFRIFNPVRQGEKFDGDGAYVRRFVPELAALPDRWLQTPWTAPDDELAAAGVRLGETYPQPVVDHGEARRRALDAHRKAGRDG